MGHTRTILNYIRHVQYSYLSFPTVNLLKHFGECGSSPEYVSGTVLAVPNQNRNSSFFKALRLSNIHSRRLSCTSSSDEEPKVVFVLGGPGSGKGTQCAKIAKTFGFEHLSAGELLRAEMNSDTDAARIIQNIIKEGKIVSSDVTVNLLRQGMQERKSSRFLIDGFPRSEENRLVYDRVIGIEPLFVLFFDCSLEEMEARLLSRKEGRIDDNLETIRKPFKVFNEVTLPVIEYYHSLGKLVTVNAGKPQQEIFMSVLPIFSSIGESMWLNLTAETKSVT